jgi:peptide-methionine (S)-S-oxide reductase
MTTTPRLRPAAALGLIVLAGLAVLPALRASAEDAARAMPAPALDGAPASSTPQTAIFAGGCFWGVQGVFEHVKGVTQAVSGYAGGTLAHPSYEQVSGGDTGHAESVRVTFDPSIVSYGQLLRIFFSVALDPTQVDRQGPDFGTQYRSELFVGTPEQDRIAHAYVAQLTAAHLFSRPIATRIDKAGAFYPAEAYHQDYLTRYPTNPYIAFNDIPKVEALKKLFPENWAETPSKVTEVASAK